MILLALNRKVFDIIRVKLFFINFKKKVNLFRRLKDNKSVQSTIKKINTLKQIYKNIIRISKKSENY